MVLKMAKAISLKSRHVNSLKIKNLSRQTEIALAKCPKIGILKIPIKAMSIRFPVFLTRTDSFLSCKIRPSIRSSDGMQVRFFASIFGFQRPKVSGEFRESFCSREKQHLSFPTQKRGSNRSRKGRKHYFQRAMDGVVQLRS